MEESSQNGKTWLIRSSTRILGPYTLDEVTQMLVSKQISIIDEIRQPFVRWSYIRENNTFLELVKNLRHEQDSSVDNTMTSTMSSQTSTKTDVITTADDLTPTPVDSDRGLRQQSSGFKDIIIAREMTPSRPLSKSSSRSFGVLGDDLVNKRIESSSSKVRMAVIGVSVLVAAFVILSFLRKEKSRDVGYEELNRSALRYKSIGLYEKALDAYKRIQTVRDADFELQYQMAPLLISEDRQSLLGRRILEKAILQEGRSRQELMEAHIEIALAYLQDGDLREAEGFLQKSRTFEPSNTEAQIDLAIIQVKKGNFAAAARDFDALAKKIPLSPLLQTLRAMAWIDNSKGNVDTAALQQLQQDIKSSISRSSYLRQELSLLLVRVNQILKNPVQEQEALQSFLAQVPFRSNQFQKSLLIDWRMGQWDYLEKYCHEAFPEKLTAWQKGARSICLMEVNRDEEAYRMITEALTERPRDATLLSIEASYLMKVRRISEATSLLKKSELATLPVAQHLRGTLCMQQGIVDCARSSYQALAQTEVGSVYVQYGLAWAALQEAHRNEAFEFAKVGLHLEPNYLPLIDLRDRLESQ